MDPIIAIGEQAPVFQLNDLSGRIHILEYYQHLIVVLNFWSAECEWCMRIDQELISYLDAWKDQVKVFWITSNAIESRDLIDRVAAVRNLPTVLLDDEQKVADLYGAQTTPHFFVLDEAGKLRYQGAWDNVTFKHRMATQVYLPKVIEALRNNRPPEITQTPPYGCALVRFPAPFD